MLVVNDHPRSHGNDPSLTIHLMNGNDPQTKAAKFGEQNVSILTFGKCLVDLFICAGNLTQANVHCFFAETCFLM